ncbi:Hypothetical protein D9617_4g000470 [Elsinoe fawcettii]|nr:Hypothetical protein D9617_4g000470 [Elsinoe fawcettii]
MQLLTVSLLLAASAFAQTPAADGTDTLVIPGAAPAGSETGFQAEFIGNENGENGYDVTCEGDADYCAGGGFVLATREGGYSVFTDADGDGVNERGEFCEVEGGVGVCRIEVRAGDSEDVVSSGTTTRTGSITLTLPPTTVTSGEGSISATVTTRPQITSTIESTITVPTTAPTGMSSYASETGCNSTSTIRIPAPTAGNNTSPTIVRPSPPAFTGAAASLTVGGSMAMVAALAFML